MRRYLDTLVSQTAGSSWETRCTKTHRNYYHLLGNVYLHGIMDGEGLERGVDRILCEVRSPFSAMEAVVEITELGGRIFSVRRGKDRTWVHEP